MGNRLKIYIAGPYTATSKAKRVANVNRAIDTAIQVLRKGHIPYVPHLTHYVDERAAKTVGRLRWQDYIAWDLEWLGDCDALLYLGNSKGARIERDMAVKWGKKVFYSIGAISAVRRKDTRHTFLRPRA